MKEIPLTQGLCAIVDDHRYEAISKYKWCAVENKGNFYAMRRIGNGKEYMHWYSAGQPLVGYNTDHINNNGLDNRDENTRTVTVRQNTTNKKSPQTSKFPGIHWNKQTNMWFAQARSDGLRKFLGRFKTEFEAFCAYRYFIVSCGMNLLKEHEDLYNTEIQNNTALIKVCSIIEHSTKIRLRSIEEDLAIKQEAVRQWAEVYCRQEGER